MKKIPFVKMNGAGNDFIIVETLLGINPKKLTVCVCHRTSGVGADGLMIASSSKKADYRMRIINADGSEAEMCGNGARCMAAYLFATKKIKGHSLTLETLAGIIHAKKVNKLISVRLSDPKDLQQNIAVTINQRSLRLCSINTGVPHAICFVNDLEKINVDQLGRLIRFNRKFAPKGTNANFVEYLTDDFIAVRTYERGVEAETLACGTGSVACAIIAYLKMNPNVTTQKNASMRVKTKSGEVLRISFDLTAGKISNVWLTGSANFIAQGQLLINS